MKKFIEKIFASLYFLLLFIYTVLSQPCYFLEICCTSRQEQLAIKELLYSQPWLPKNYVQEDNSSVLIGPCDLNEAQDLRKRLETELNLVTTINVSVVDIEEDLNSKLFLPDTNFNSDKEDSEMVLSEYDKEITTETLKLYSDERITKIISLALEFYAVPYKWGGTNIERGIDCSFFVQYVFKKLGINLPRTSREQFKIGLAVDKDNLEPGDLVFFKKVRYRKVKNKIRKYEYINHVGIYLKDNEFIHATRGARRVTISSLEEPYYKSRYAGARRVIKNDL
ncbi:MAG: C40 family peptidase [Endomicrobia bacterium]|nr:C40 family peptidase [Endomicrobiia bacterium]MDW8055191.1 C40 family peptidase [Elusimicrobiota bacterium]